MNSYNIGRNQNDDHTSWRKEYLEMKGWSIEITNPIVERGAPSTSTGMVAPSDAQRLQEDEGDQGTS